MWQKLISMSGVREELYLLSHADISVRSPKQPRQKTQLQCYFKSYSLKAIVLALILLSAGKGVEPH